MDNRDILLRKISAHEFAAWEIQIFLDTHPNNKMALDKKAAHEKKARELRELFEKEFGLLDSRTTCPMQRWEWIDDPWPWDSSKEAKR